jgi:ABC-2 type transport system ATP-binding protein
MTVDESIRFTRAFHSNWDDSKADELLRRFGLPSGKKIKQLSRGNRARVCLLLALAFNPELIILDEPTSGLDPIVRRDFLENMIWEIGQEGRTVLFSSHIVEEIERIADYVTIIDNGRILTTSTVDALKSSVKRIRFITNGDIPDLSSLPGVLAIYRTRHEQVLTVQNPAENLLEQFQQLGVEHPEWLPMSLEEIFVDSVRAQRRLSGDLDGREELHAPRNL